MSQLMMMHLDCLHECLWSPHTILEVCSEIRRIASIDFNKLEMPPLIKNRTHDHVGRSVVGF